MNMNLIFTLSKKSFLQHPSDCIPINIIVDPWFQNGFEERESVPDTLLASLG